MENLLGIHSSKVVKDMSKKEPKKTVERCHNEVIEGPMKSPVNQSKELSKPLSRKVVGNLYSGVVFTVAFIIFLTVFFMYLKRYLIISSQNELINDYLYGSSGIHSFGSSHIFDY